MSDRRLRNRTGIGLCLVLALASSLPPPPAHGSPRAGSTSVQGRGGHGAGHHLARLGSILDSMEEVARRVPRSTFDPLAVLAEIGRDPRAMAQWVRERTALLPYRGVLRGWKGVLMDRRGNSLDRSLLLCKLLALSGSGPLRLARTRLPVDVAEALLGETRRGGSEESPPFRSPRDVAEHPDFEKLCGKFDAPAGEVREAFEGLTLDCEKALEEFARRVASQVATVSAGVGHVEEDGQRSREIASSIESLRDHWWVQLDSSGSWLDLDVTLPEAVRASGALEAEETRDLARSDSPGEDEERWLAALDAEVHRVDVRVVIERWQEEERSEVPLVEASLVACRHSGDRIALRHVPPYWPISLDLAKEADPIARLKEVVLEQREWIPVLTVGTDPRIRHSFEPDGTLHDATLPEYVSALRSWQAGIQGLGDRLGGMLGGDRGREAAERKEGGVVTAEWIEFRFRGPGIAERVVRRDVFDLLSATDRSSGIDLLALEGRHPRLERGLALLGATETLLTASALSPEFVVHESLTGVAAKRSLLEDATREGTSERSAALGKIVESGVGREALLTLAAFRLGPAATRAGLYVDSPNVISYWSTFSVDEEERLRHVQAFDIVSNGIGVLPTPGAGPFQARLRQGVVDTVAEAVLLPVLTAGGTVVDNPSELAARRADLRWIAVRSEDDPAWTTLPLPGDARARMLRDVREGWIVLVPVGEPVSDRGFAWWRVDPRTGETLGVGRRGWGQSASEYLMASAGSAGFGVATALLWCYASGSSLGSNDCQCLILVSALLGAFSGPLFLGLTGYTVLMGILTGMAIGEAVPFVVWWFIGTWWVKEFCKA